MDLLIESNRSTRFAIIAKIPAQTQMPMAINANTVEYVISLNAPPFGLGRLVGLFQFPPQPLGFRSRVVRRGFGYARRGRPVPHRSVNRLLEPFPTVRAKLNLVGLWLFHGPIIAQRGRTRIRPRKQIYLWIKRGARKASRYVPQQVRDSPKLLIYHN